MMIVLVACGRPKYLKDTQGDISINNTKKKLKKTSNSMDRYYKYLNSFGIITPNDKVFEFQNLKTETLSFFAYNGRTGVRFKTITTPNGILTPYPNPDDDWYGFFSEVRDAHIALQNLAWLKTDLSTMIHGRRMSPTLGLMAGNPPVLGINPAEWAFVKAPKLKTNTDKSINLVAWFLESGVQIPTQWIITAFPDTKAVFKFTPASDFLIEQIGSSQGVTEYNSINARKYIIEGTYEERWWALNYIRESRDFTAIESVEALLLNKEIKVDLKVNASGTLASFGDLKSIKTLGYALCNDSYPRVRRACAQALSIIHNKASIQVLSSCAIKETDVNVRIEIVHALVAQGELACKELHKIAQNDPDESVRYLAGINCK